MVQLFPETSLGKRSRGLIISLILSVPLWHRYVGTDY